MMFEAIFKNCIMTRIFKTTFLAGVLLLVVSSFTNSIFAQGREIKGRVTSSDNQPLSGVSVTIKGTKTATVTDATGTYKISVTGNATLVFTSVGYVAYEVGTSGKSEVNISMTQEVKTGEDVVVIGYQSIKRKNLLASV